MKRSNISFVLSLIIHILAVLVFSYIHREAITRWRQKAIPVEFNVKPPEPRLEKRKPELKKPVVNPEHRPTNRTQSPRFVKINRDMDRTTAYRDVIITDDTDRFVDMEATEGNLQTEGSFNLSPRARGAGPAGRDRSQLIEFIEKSRGKRRIIYCMDVSASMGAADKLNLARNYLKDSLLALDSEKDRFNVLAFAQSARIFYSSGLLPASRENVSSALRFLDDYTPQSIMDNKKTDLLAVLMRALEMKPNIIVLVTDGLPTTGVTNPEKIIQSVREKNDGSVRIFAIGMEMDVELPEAWLLRAIAEQNKGEYQFL